MAEADECCWRAEIPGLWRAQMELGRRAALLRGGTTGAGAKVAASLAGRQYVAASIRLPALRLMAPC